MQQKKLLDAHRTAQRACELLRAHPRHAPGQDTVLTALQTHLRELLPSLSILHSFEADKDCSTVFVYEIVAQTIAQVASMNSASDSGGGGGAPPQIEPGPSSEGPAGGAADVPSEPSEQPPAGENDAPPLTATPSGTEEDPPLRWSDVQGCEDAIAALKQATVLPRQFPWLFASGTGRGGEKPLRRPWQRVLLYGPPGTGKTLLARATAGEMANCPFVNLSSADVLSKWVGESEKHIRAAFVQAAKHDRCILFLDEMDALCGSRGAQGETEVARRLKTELLFHLQGLPPSVTVLAATNLPWEIDSAILRRFDALVYVGLPPAAARRSLIRRELEAVDHTLAAADVARLVARTEGFSASDLVRVVSHAAMAPLKSLIDATHLRLATAEEVGDYCNASSGIPAAEAAEPSPAPHSSRRKRAREQNGAAERPMTSPALSSVSSLAYAGSGCSGLAAVTPLVSPRLRAVGALSVPHHPAADGGRKLHKVTLPKRSQAQDPPPDRDEDRPTGSSSSVKEPDGAHACPSVGSQCFYVPCPASDPRVLPCSLSASGVDRDSLLMPRMAASDVRDALGSFIPSVTRASVDKYAEWRRSQNIMR